MAESPPRRDYTPRETRLVAEYVARTWPEGGWSLHQRLGPPIRSERGQFLSQAELDMVGQVYRRWADAVIVEPTRTIVLEGKMVLQPAVISQLELYLELVPQTPELTAYLDRPREGWILCAIEDPATKAMAIRRGLRVVTFRPPWVDEYLNVLRVRERRAPVQPVFAGDEEVAE